MKICVITEDKKSRILDSCHAGIEGKNRKYILFSTIIVYLYACVRVGSHLGRNKTIQNNIKSFLLERQNNICAILRQEPENY